jgi:hypothetical protein
MPTPGGATGRSLPRLRGYPRKPSGGLSGLSSDRLRGGIVGVPELNQCCRSFDPTVLVLSSTTGR